MSVARVSIRNDHDLHRSCIVMVHDGIFKARSPGFGAYNVFRDGSAFKGLFFFLHVAI